MPKKLKNLPAWHCLALSVDVDPQLLGMDHFLMLNAARNSMPMPQADDPKWLQTMAKRWNVLANALHKEKELRADKRTTDIELDTQLDFSAFLEFAKRKRWGLPKQLKT